MILLIGATNNMRDPVKKHLEIRQQLEKEQQEIEKQKERKKAYIHILTIVFTPIILFIMLLFNIKEE